MATTRTLRQIDADLASQVRHRKECTDRISRLSERVIDATATIDCLLAERSHALGVACLETAHYALTQAEVEGR